jgi:dTDP-L-rhamnose 4-epimerase
MRDFVHVADVACANVVALESVTQGPVGRFDAYNVCSGEPVSILRVAQLVGAGSGIEPEVTGGYRLGDVRHVVACPDRARSELGFAARVHADEGLPAFASAPLRP